MLDEQTLNRILKRLPSLTIGVVGDLFLDRYLDLDATLTEPSLETGLDAHQVVRVRSSPGAAGTVINNLVALGVGKVNVVSIIGADGEGYELRQALTNLGVVDQTGLFVSTSRRTPTYTKPMLHQPAQPARELNRLDIKNRTPVPADLEEQLKTALLEIWPRVDALVVSDQVSEADCGVITGRIRAQLALLGESNPAKLLLADSRERIGQFRSVWLKPNQTECLRALGRSAADPCPVRAAVVELARLAGRPVFCTCGEEGILLADLAVSNTLTVVPAYPVTGRIDVVGAGDSASAGIACSIAAGAGLVEAAAFGNLIASITIQQIGTTGTATPTQVRKRWEEVSGPR
jgi:rfaE bifunctional protein kinase chain/domain